MAQGESGLSDLAEGPEKSSIVRFFTSDKQLERASETRKVCAMKIGRFEEAHHLLFLLAKYLKGGTTSQYVLLSRVFIVP